MDRLLEIAKAKYRASSSTKWEDKFTEDMEKYEGLRNFAHFERFMRSKRYDYYVNQKLFDSLVLLKCQNFWKMNTLYYIINSGRPICRSCHVLLTSMYFACAKCYESSRVPYCLCWSCYTHTKTTFTHSKCDGHRPHFRDNFALLEKLRHLAFQKKAGAKDDFDINRRPARCQTPNKLKRSKSVGRK